MLRKRFLKWGIDNKKNKEPEMRAMVRKTAERSRIGKSSTFRARGRILQYKDVVRYWERRHLSIEDVLTRITSREPTPDGLEVVTPVPSPVLPPAQLEISERILRGISNYICASFESRTWVFTTEDFFCKCKKEYVAQNVHASSIYGTAGDVCDLFRAGKPQ